MEPQHRQPVRPEDILTEPKPRALSRRALLKVGALGLASAATLGMVDGLAFLPRRVAMAAPVASGLPDIQFDIGNFIAPVQTINGLQFHFGPVFTLFVTAKLTRTPTKQDQQVLTDALNVVEANYDFSPSGVFVFTAYGLPYFQRLPSSLVANHMPRLLADNSRFVLEEAVPSPTDVSPQNPQIKKKTYNVPVVIESNDVLFSLRSDNMVNLFEVLGWLQGSGIINGNFVASPEFNGLFSFTSARLMFVQPGLPRQLANLAGLPYARKINPTSPMWMGFADQHVNAAGPAPIVTFVGNSKAKLSTAKAGDYFDNGSIQHLSHVIEDLAQFYDSSDPENPETFSERVQYMFSSRNENGDIGLLYPQDPRDAFSNGGGLNATSIPAEQQRSAYLPNVYFGADASLTNYDVNTFKQGTKKLRVGHEAALQRSSRLADGTPLHIRMDGPGFDALDVPDGSSQPKLQFSGFFPTAEFFRVMRSNAASLDLVAAPIGDASSVPAGVQPSDPDDDGLERHITATRRQNFLVPPRRHRVFPLVELT
jgi:hypothetical protein